MRNFSDIINIFAQALYPKRCPLCDSVLHRDENFICKGCRHGFKFLTGGTCARCGVVLKSAEAVICSECENKRRLTDGGFAPFAYDGSIQDSLIRFKYKSRAEYAAFYARCIYEYGAERMAAWRAEVLIPVPIHYTRLQERGYNQAYLISKELEKLCKLPVYDELVIRKKKTHAQKELNAVQRRKNLIDAFEYASTLKAPETAVIVDDIYTTGSTVDALGYILRSHGAKHVYVVCVATA